MYLYLSRDITVMIVIQILTYQRSFYTYLKYIDKHTSRVIHHLYYYLLIRESPHMVMSQNMSKPWYLQGGAPPSYKLVYNPNNYRL